MIQDRRCQHLGLVPGAGPLRRLWGVSMAATALRRINPSEFPITLEMNGLTLEDIDYVCQHLQDFFRGR